MHTRCQIMHEGRLVQRLLLWSKFSEAFSMHSPAQWGEILKKSSAVKRVGFVDFYMQYFWSYYFFYAFEAFFSPAPYLWALTLPSVKMWPGMFPTGHQLTVVVRYDYLLHSNRNRSSLWNTVCTVWLCIRMTSHISYELLSVSDANSVDLKGWLRLNEAQGWKLWDILYVYLKKKKCWMRMIDWLCSRDCRFLNHNI